MDDYHKLCMGNNKDDAVFTFMECRMDAYIMLIESSPLWIVGWVMIKMKKSSPLRNVGWVIIMMMEFYG